MVLAAHLYAWRKAHVPARHISNFCAQAADLVRVGALLCRQNGRSRHFRWKSVMVLQHFASKPHLAPSDPRCFPDGS